ncbi:hypothetical protein [Sphingobacterium multivorum]|uniref:hypothetical protein n=1 Tax=Sphingobacterium multivorum TaxID=28454 RepID=UPI000E98936E|nr:hypothetical protein [Sphingobacterium multivorum]HBI86611.1 hypothetical protein [Sphingobacterium sp.]
MAHLKQSEKVILEKIFKMEGGYVLEFSNQKFQQFIFDNFKIDIYSDRYSIYGDSKANRLRAFWSLENNQDVGKLILELTEIWKTEMILKGVSATEGDNSLEQEAIRISDKLRGVVSQNVKKEETVDDFLSKDFEIVSLEKLKIDGAVIDVLDARIIEIKNSIKSKSPLSCVILCGSVLEGILLGIASSKMREYNQCSISPKNKETQKVLAFNDWTLSNFIDVSHNLGLLGLDVKKYSHSLRDFRNYIHPYQQMTSRFNPDIETAKISWQVLKAAITDLSKNV